MKTNILSICWLLGLLMNTYGQESQSIIIDKYIQNYAKNVPIPGFSIVLVDREQTLFKKAYGVQNIEEKEPILPSSVLRIGSLTKSFTALAVMQLVEEEKLDLDTPIIEYLSDFQTANPEKSDHITMRMLLSHTSGLPGADISGGYKHDYSTNAIKELMKSLSSYFIINEPGNAFEYSNEGYSLAGLIISKVSGLSYQDYVKKNILDPLNMGHSETAPSRIQQGKILKGHHLGFSSGIPAQNPSGAGAYIPAGALMASNIDDLSHYLQMLLGKENKERIISSKSLREMWTSHITFPGLSQEEGGDGNAYDYGLGWVISNIDGRKLIHHSGSTGTSSSLTIIDVENGRAVSILMNIDFHLLNTYQYIRPYYLLNNILHLWNETPLSDFGKTQTTDPSLNTFEPSDKEKYCGLYFLSGEGHPFLGNLQLRVSRRKNGSLKGIASQEGEIVLDFDLDFVNASLAMSRHIGMPTALRFNIHPYGGVTGLYFMGMAFSKLERSPYKDYKAWVSPATSYRFLLPPNWQVNWTSNGFHASDSLSQAILIQDQALSSLEEFVSSQIEGASIISEVKNHQELLGNKWWNQTLARARLQTGKDCYIGMFYPMGEESLQFFVLLPSEDLTQQLYKVVSPILMGL